MIEDIPVDPNTEPECKCGKDHNGGPEVTLSTQSKLHMAAAMLFTFVCYFIPLTFTGYLFTSDRS